MTLELYMNRAIEETESLAEPLQPGNYRHNCPICESSRMTYLFVSHGYPICQCLDCNLLFRNPLPPEEVLQQIYSENYFLGEDSEDRKARVSAMKRATAKLYLERLITYAGIQEGRLLEIGCGTGELLLEARQLGFTVAGLEVSPHAAAAANAKIGCDAVLSGTLEKQELPLRTFDICVLSDVLEHVR